MCCIFRGVLAPSGTPVDHDAGVDHCGEFLFLLNCFVSFLSLQEYSLCMIYSRELYSSIFRGTEINHKLFSDLCMAYFVLSKFIAVHVCCITSVTYGAFLFIF